jgi:hypothetical protein
MIAQLLRRGAQVVFWLLVAAGLATIGFWALLLQAYLWGG